MSRLILVRHGQTDWNLKKRILSWQNIPLNEEGLRQSRGACQRLEKEIFSLIYSSELGRAIQTAEIIARDYGLDIIRDKRLNEMNQGDWDGLHDWEALEKYPIMYKQWLEDPTKVVPPNGESIKTLESRVEDFINMLETRHPAENVCVVTHEMVIGAFLCLVEGINFSLIRRLKTPNGQIRILNISAKKVYEKT